MPSATLSPIKDTWVDENDPTVNYSAQAWLRIRDSASVTNRAILEFPLFGEARLPNGATIVTATLRLYYFNWADNDPVGRAVWAYLLTRTDWVEAQATWNVYSTGNNWATAGGDFVTSNPAGGSANMPAAYGWVEFNVTAIVTQAYNQQIPAEFLIKFNAEDNANASNTRFYSQDEATQTSLRPQLVINYTLPIPPRAGAAKFIGNPFDYDPNLILHLPLQELDGASFISRDKYGHLATVTGALWSPDGYLFDGIDDSITAPHHVGLNPDTITVAVWVKIITEIAAFNTIISKWWDGTDRSWDLGYHNTNYIYFNCAFTGHNADHIVQSAAASITLGQWSFAVGTYDGAVVRFYLNGVSVGTPIYEIDTLRKNTVQFGIGRDMRATPTTPNNCQVAWAKIWNRALNDMEITNLYLDMLTNNPRFRSI